MASSDNIRAGRPLEPRLPSAPDGPPGLGEVARDAVDHIKVIVSDSVALGKLEAKRVVAQVERTTRDVAPRLAWGMMAAALGFVGAVLGLIAIFIGLGAVIPSVAVRLAIFAATFLLGGAVFGFLAARPRTEPPRERVVVSGATVKRLDAAGSQASR